jgi:Cytochrome c552
VCRWFLALALVACSAARDEQAAPVKPVDSTIAARDYIGPDACGECHPEQHALWKASLHRVMNQRAEDDAIIAPAGASLAYRGGTVQLDGDSLTFARGADRVRYRITRTIGKRSLQEFVGIADGTTLEVRLPVGWWPRHGGLYPQPFFDPWLKEDDLDIYKPVKEPWAERCPWCHSTYPFEARIARSSGKQLGHGLEQYFDGPPAGMRLDVARQVTTGISCESCHLGGRAHAAGAPIHFVPLGAEPKDGAPAPTAFAIERLDAGIVNTVCAQCHSGPSPRLADGTATRNSSEALDLAASACSTARCTHCHEPHSGGFSEPRAIAACIGCHEAQSTPAHAGKGHSAVTCLDCHMPKVTMGIDRYVRTHRISSPTNTTMLAAAAPNACNLCHLDRSIRWTLDELHIDAGNLDAYGDPDEAVGSVWLASREGDVRVTAAMAYARSKLGRRALPELLPLLDDARPYVRAWSQFAVEEILGKKLDGYDARAPAVERRAAIAKLRR